ncbi:hypothetical protein HW932_10955 [Allochromatium humboldtianum]|uniref:Uncharacterized protein n=1 Tax=Allochromatium humboldtianum TaxID=504901 RepID=A0A850R517_9GAMM|nr:hypothetical protein [Allochromatium humboldtianum]NVZ09779.1 hypothetical protein [Allochromatium humboldtianum]
MNASFVIDVDVQHLNERLPYEQNCRINQNGKITAYNSMFSQTVRFSQFEYAVQPLFAKASQLPTVRVTGYRLKADVTQCAAVHSLFAKNGLRLSAKLLLMMLQYYLAKAGVSRSAIDQITLEHVRFKQVTLYYHFMTNSPQEAAAVFNTLDTILGKNDKVSVTVNKNMTIHVYRESTVVNEVARDRYRSMAQDAAKALCIKLVLSGKQLEQNSLHEPAKFSRETTKNALKHGLKEIQKHLNSDPWLSMQNPPEWKALNDLFTEEHRCRLKAYEEARYTKTTAEEARNDLQQAIDELFSSSSTTASNGVKPHPQVPPVPLLSSSGLATPTPTKRRVSSQRKRLASRS